MSGCTIFQPQSRPCGEFGTCVNASVPYCVCAPGYSSFGDFSIFEQNPCDINLYAIRALWGATIAGIIGAFGAAIWGILSRRQAGKIQWKAWRLWTMPYFVMGQSSVLLALSIGKIINPETWIIGASIPATILHGLTATLAITYLVIGLSGVSRTAYIDTLKGKSSTDRLEMKIKLRRLESGIALFWIAGAASCFIPCAALVNPSNIYWSAGVHGCGLAFVMFLLGSIIAPKQFSMVLEKVSESVQALDNKTAGSNQKMKTVRFKLRFAKQIASVGFAVSAISIALISLWPFLIVKSGYALPAFYLIVELVGGLFIWITTTTNALSLRRPSIFSKRISGTRKSVDRRSSLTLASPSPGPSTRRPTLDAALLPISPSPNPDF